MLLDVGADINASSKFDTMTPLMVASMRGASPEVVSLLIEAGADVNAMTEGGKSVLMIAQGFNDDSKIRSMILEASADTVQ